MILPRSPHLCHDSSCAISSQCHISCVFLSFISLDLFVQRHLCHDNSPVWQFSSDISCPFLLTPLLSNISPFESLRTKTSCNKFCKLTRAKPTPTLYLTAGHPKRISCQTSTKMQLERTKGTSFGATVTRTKPRAKTSQARSRHFVELSINYKGQQV